MNRHSTLSTHRALAAALFFVIAITGCSKSGQQSSTPAPAGASAPAEDNGAAATAAGAPASPAAPPSADEQKLLDQAQKAATPADRRQIYAQLVRMHPENKQYKHELRRARREARAARQQQGGQPQGGKPQGGQPQ